MWINTAASGLTNNGAVLSASDDTYFGSSIGGVRTLNDFFQARCRQYPACNPPRASCSRRPPILNLGQYVDLRSNNSAYAVVGLAGDGDSAAIGSNASSAAYNFRAASAGGQFVNNYLTAPNNGSGVLGIDSVYTQPIDLGHIGDGTWFLGSASNGLGQDGTYVGSTALTAGASYTGTGNTNSTYRLGGDGGNLYIGIYPGDASSVPNQLTGTANLVVGAPLTSGVGTTVARGTGSVILNTAQNYTGATVVNVGSQLEFRGQLTTSRIQCLWRLQFRDAFDYRRRRRRPLLAR